MFTAFFALFASAAAGQTPADGAQSKLETLLMRRDLPIRDFLADPKVQYGWEAGGLTHGPVHLYATSVLRVDSVKIAQSDGFLKQVTISGKRRILLRDADNKIGAAPMSEPVVLQVDLNGQGPANLEDLTKTLFYGSTAEMVAAVPPQDVRMAPGYPTGVHRPDAALFQNQMWIEQAGIWTQVDRKSKGFRLPKVVFQPAPEFSEEARRVQVSGNVLVGLHLDDQGRVAKLWLLRPLGEGLDEKALAVAAQYRFEPCMWQGHAVGMVMQVEINFQLF